MARRFVLDISPRDADAPGHFDLHLDTEKLLGQLRGEPCLDRLCRKMAMSRSEVVKQFMPGAYVDSNSQQAKLNAGYDPDFDEGQLEILIWEIVVKEVRQLSVDGKQ